MHDLQRPLLAVLLLLAPLSPAPAHACGAVAGQAAPAAEKGEALLQRVVVVGASLSAGHGLGADEKGVPLTLARVIDAGIAARHEKVLNLSDLMTFMDPSGAGQRTQAAIGKHGATLVVALDYLFWFGYGANWGDEKGRLAGLEQGLKSLEGLACPILLGDFPDMRSALQARHPVLPRQSVPEPATLVQLNERLAAWAKGHPNVIVVPISSLMGELLAGEELRVGPNLWPKGTVSGLLQDDGLHPTLEGTTGLWLAAAERLFEARKDLPRSALEPKAGTIAGKLAPEQKLKVVYEPIQSKAGKSGPAKIVH